MTQNFNVSVKNNLNQQNVYSDNFIFMGNPFLKPEFSTQYELSFKSPIPMGFAYINLYYHHNYLKPMLN